MSKKMFVGYSTKILASDGKALTRKKGRERATLKTGRDRRGNATKKIKCQWNFDVKLRQVMNTFGSGDGVSLALQ